MKDLVPDPLVLLTLVPLIVFTLLRGSTGGTRGRFQAALAVLTAIVLWQVLTWRALGSCTEAFQHGVTEFPTLLMASGLIYTWNDATWVFGASALLLGVLALLEGPVRSSYSLLSIALALATTWTFTEQQALTVLTEGGRGSLAVLFLPHLQPVLGLLALGVAAAGGLLHSRRFILAIVGIAILLQGAVLIERGNCASFPRVQAARDIARDIPLPSGIGMAGCCHGIGMVWRNGGFEFGRPRSPHPDDNVYLLAAPAEWQVEPLISGALPDPAVVRVLVNRPDQRHPFFPYGLLGTIELWVVQASTELPPGALHLRAVGSLQELADECVRRGGGRVHGNTVRGGECVVH